MEQEKLTLEERIARAAGGGGGGAEKRPQEV